MASIQDKIAAQKLARERAEKLVEANADEIADRETFKREEEATKDAEEKLILLGLERRRDAAEDANPGKVLRALHIKGTIHSFVLTNPGQKAFLDWERGFYEDGYAKAVDKKPKVDRIQSAILFAAASVVDFDGATDFSSATENYNDLIQFLTANPAIRQDVANVASDLAKTAAEERKSPG